MAVFALERFAFGLTAEGVEAAARRVAASGPVTHLLTLFVPGDEAALSVFQADDRSALEAAATSEGTPFERVVEVRLVPHQRS